MPQQQRAGAVAVANEEAVRAWNTVLYERWKSNRKVFVGALAKVTEDVFELFPPPERGCCIDIGCGFGETTQQLAELVGPGGFALGTDSSPRFIEDARHEAVEAGVENVAFETADAQTAEWDPIYDYAFSWLPRCRSEAHRRLCRCRGSQAFKDWPSSSISVTTRRHTSTYTRDASDTRESRRRASRSIPAN